MKDLLKIEKLADLIKKSDIEILDQAIFESNCTEELIQSITYYLIRCRLQEVE